MIFSDKIFKIIDGKNATLYKPNQDTLNLYIFNKTMKKYVISEISSKNCVFSKILNYDKIMELGGNKLAVCCNDFITIINANEI